MIRKELHSLGRTSPQLAVHINRLAGGQGADPLHCLAAFNRGQRNQLGAGDHSHLGFGWVAHINQCQCITGIDALLELLNGDTVHLGQFLRRRSGATNAAERLIVNQSIDHGTTRCRLQLELAKTHGQAIHQQQPSVEGLANACDQLDRLRGLQQANQARHHPEHAALGTGGHQPRRRRLRHQIAVMGAISRAIEHADLPLKPLNGAIDQRLPQQHTGVVDEVTTGEVVGAVADHVVGLQQLQRIGRRELRVVALHPAMGIEVLDPSLCRGGFGPAHRGRAVNHLTLKIGMVDHIEINDADPADTGGRQIEQQGRTEPTTADAQHRCSL